MGAPRLHRCKYPDCSRIDIKPGAIMCTKHWRIYYAVLRAKGNKNKSLTNIIKLMRKKLEKNAWKILLRNMAAEKKTEIGMW